jgi:hypothetical protein
MSDNDRSQVWRRLDISPGEVGSRRITSGQLQAFLEDLRSIGLRPTIFLVLRFGHEDQLFYPAERVHEAIEHYDVRRISGHVAHPEVSPTEPFIEIYLSNDYSVLRPPCFRFLGPRPLVEEAEALVWEHINRWQLTWHRWFHHEHWNMGIAVVLGFMFFIHFLRFIDPRSSLDVQDVIIPFAVLVYLLAFMVLVLVGTKTLAPFIWFYRPGSPIEAQRQWLPRLSIFAVLAITSSAVGSLLWSLFDKWNTSPWLR